MEERSGSWKNLFLAIKQKTFGTSDYFIGQNVILHGLPPFFFPLSMSQGRFLQAHSWRNKRHASLTFSMSLGIFSALAPEHAHIARFLQTRSTQRLLPHIHSSALVLPGVQDSIQMQTE